MSSRWEFVNRRRHGLILAAPIISSSCNPRSFKCTSPHRALLHPLPTLAIRQPSVRSKTLDTQVFVYQLKYSNGPQFYPSVQTTPLDCCLECQADPPCVAWIFSAIILGSTPYVPARFDAGTYPNAVADCSQAPIANIQCRYRYSEFANREILSTCLSLY